MAGLNNILKKPDHALWIVIAFGFGLAVTAGMAGEELSYNLLIFVSSLLLLIKSAEYLVEGSSRIASYFGIPTIIIGITVVAFGTSLPELTVSTLANLMGSPGLSIGNVVGSNISNICLVLGIAAILVPIKINKEIFAFNLPFLIGVSMLLPILSMRMFYDFSGSGYVIGLLDGIVLLSLFGFFIHRQVKKTKIHRKEEPRVKMNRKVVERRRKMLSGHIAVVGAGLTGLIVSAGLLVESGRGIAYVFGVPEILIGLTMVAVGTSLPELATNIMAAFKKKLDLAIGNVIGSNIFNILLVLGASSVIKPIGNIPQSTVLIDMSIMIGLTVLLAIIMKSGHDISRGNGIALFVLYVFYISYLFVRMV